MVLPDSAELDTGFRKAYCDGNGGSQSEHTTVLNELETNMVGKTQRLEQREPILAFVVCLLRSSFPWNGSH